MMHDAFNEAMQRERSQEVDKPGASKRGRCSRFACKPVEIKPPVASGEGQIALSSNRRSINGVRIEILNERIALA